jgi:hypothetical protein
MADDAATTSRAENKPKYSQAKESFVEKNPCRFFFFSSVYMSCRPCCGVAAVVTILVPNPAGECALAGKKRPGANASTQHEKTSVSQRRHKLSRTQKAGVVPRRLF